MSHWKNMPGGPLVIKVQVNRQHHLDFWINLFLREMEPQHSISYNVQCEHHYQHSSSSLLSLLLSSSSLSSSPLSSSLTSQFLVAKKFIYWNKGYFWKWGNFLRTFLIKIFSWLIINLLRFVLKDFEILKEERLISTKIFRRKKWTISLTICTYQNISYFWSLDSLYRWSLCLFLLGGFAIFPNYFPSPDSSYAV